jgi:hypothetical protein
MNVTDVQKIDFNFPIFTTKLKLNSDLVNFANSIKLEDSKQTVVQTTYHYAFDKDEEGIKKNVELSILIKKNIDFFLKYILEQLNFSFYEITYCWVQKYNKLNYHDCHIHNADGFSFIIYINCSEKSSDTIFYNVGHPYLTLYNYKIKPEIGKCIVFHGAIPHGVLPNEDNERMIVSGNIIMK